MTSTGAGGSGSADGAIATSADDVGARAPTAWRRAAPERWIRVDAACACARTRRSASSAEMLEPENLARAFALSAAVGAAEVSADSTALLKATTREL